MEVVKTTIFDNAQAKRLARRLAAKRRVGENEAMDWLAAVFMAAVEELVLYESTNVPGLVTLLLNENKNGVLYVRHIPSGHLLKTINDLKEEYERAKADHRLARMRKDDKVA